MPYPDCPDCGGTGRVETFSVDGEAPREIPCPCCADQWEEQ